MDDLELKIREALALRDIGRGLPWFEPGCDDVFVEEVLELAEQASLDDRIEDARSVVEEAKTLDGSPGSESLIGSFERFLAHLEMRRWGKPRPVVACPLRCRAFETPDPDDLGELRAALDHWANHQLTKDNS